MGRNCLLILFLVTLVNVALGQVVWEFGKNSRKSKVVSHNKGEITIFNKVTHAPFTVPDCMKVNYVRVMVENMLATPAVTYNDDSHTVVISYLPLQISRSKYEVIAKAKPKPNCGESKKKKKSKGKKGKKSKGKRN